MRRLVYYARSSWTLVRRVRNWPVLLRELAGLPHRRPFDVRLRDGAVFRVRGFMDAWIVKEAYLDRDYEVRGTALRPGWTVVDVGACIGAFALSAGRDASVRVHACEPSPESYALLCENLGRNGARNVTPHRLAVTGASGPVTLHRFAGHPEQDSLTPTRSAAAAAPCLVEGVSLADLLDRLGIGRCDLLKLDCEGAEFDILLQAPDEALERVSHVCLEYHDGVTPHTHRDLLRRFEQLGFATRRTRSPVLPDEGFIYARRRLPNSAR